MESTRTTSSKRKVSFNKQVEAVHIRHHKDYSKKEFERCWHSHEDYEAMKTEVNHTIDSYNQSLNDIDDSLHLRGLEHRTSSGKGTKAYLRKAAWDAVLDEQEALYELGMPNHSEMLREVYSIYSLPASRIAQQRAWKDAMEAGYMAEAKPPMAAISKQAPACNFSTIAML